MWKWEVWKGAWEAGVDEVVLLSIMYSSIPLPIEYACGFGFGERLLIFMSTILLFVCKH